MYVFAKLLLFWKIGLHIVFALSDVPNISGDYKIISVIDDTYLSGNLTSKLTTAEHENINANISQIWKLKQHHNETSYTIMMADKKFQRIQLITTSNGNGLQLQWQLAPVGRNLWIIFENVTKKCLTNYNGEGEEGKAVNLSETLCGNTTKQLWSLLNLDSSQAQDYSGVYYIQSQINGQFVSGSSNTHKRWLLNHMRNNNTFAQEWKIDRRYEYGDCYEIKLFKNHSQIIPLKNESNVVERLPLVWTFQLVGQARWKIRQLNSDHCLGFISRESTGKLEVESVPCETGGVRQVWFLIRISNPNSVNGHRKCVALNSSSQLKIWKKLLNAIPAFMLLTYYISL